MDIDKFLKQIGPEFLQLIHKGLHRVFETKHLYQNVELDVSEFQKTLKAIKRKYNPNYELKCIDLYNAFVNSKWRLFPLVCDPQKDKLATDEIPVLLPTIKIYCSTCDRIEPFNPVSKEHHIMNYPKRKTKDIIHQLFVIEYECQSCKGLPYVFMLRRKGLKIYLVGRYPIEAIPTPKVIPKSHSKYYSDAIIAHNCGQTLAGLFFLRTLIEQYTRSLSSNKELLPDELIENYMKQLPVEFKSRFPSLGKIYEDLSVAIHKADASSKLFDKTLNELVEHFDAKRIFKIKDKIV